MEPGRRHADQIGERVGLVAKSLIIFPRVAVGRRLSRIRILADELHELARIPYRQRTQHQGVDQAEDRGVGTDPEGEGQDRDAVNPGVRRIMRMA